MPEDYVGHFVKEGRMLKLSEGIDSYLALHRVPLEVPIRHPERDPPNVQRH